MKAKRLGIPISVIIGMAGIIAIWVNLPTYHYIGVQQVSIETARQMQLEQSSKSNIGLMAYDSNTDKIYISYNFDGSQDLAKKYGIPEGIYDNQLYSCLVISGFIMVLVYVALYAILN